MFKRIMTTLAVLLAVLGFAATPASGDSGSAGDVVLYEQTNFMGTFEAVPEVDIPTTCSTIPAILGSARSAQNVTSGPGTAIALFPASDLACASAIVTLQPGQSAAVVTDPSNSSLGAGRWQAVTTD